MTSNCDRTAYVDFDTMLDAFLAHYGRNEDSEAYIKGKERLMEDLEVYTIRRGNIFSSALYLSMQTLMSSGIYAKWHEWYHIQFPTEEQRIIRMALREEVNNQLPKRLGIVTNVSTAFLMYLTCILVALVVLIQEKSAWRVYLLYRQLRVRLLQWNVRLRLNNFISRTAIVIQQYMYTIKFNLIMLSK
jgi:hypothetical protein